MAIHTEPDAEPCVHIRQEESSLLAALLNDGGEVLKPHPSLSIERFRNGAWESHDEGTLPAMQPPDVSPGEAYGPLGVELPRQDGRYRVTLRASARTEGAEQRRYTAEFELRGGEVETEQRCKEA
jgi:hypothetical protein